MDFISSSMKPGPKRSRQRILHRKKKLRESKHHYSAEPVRSAESMDTVELVCPAEPVNTEGPVEAVYSAEPVNTEGPVEPEHSAEPVEPAEENKVKMGHPMLLQ
jgi:hypothetical protein